MAQNNYNVEIDPKELKNAQSTWAKFVNAGKWTVISVAVVLVLMALFLV